MATRSYHIAIGYQPLLPTRWPFGNETAHCPGRPLSEDELPYEVAQLVHQAPRLANERNPTVKQFIRNVRAAKTIADERAVIQKESAAIRASFREESADHTIRYAYK